MPGWDGVPPSDVLARFRADLAAYPTARIVDGTVAGVSGAIDGFTLDVGAAGTFASRRVLLAHGVRDILPAIPGLSDGWGKTVLHCPYCHGYEVRNRPLAVLATGPMATHQAHMLLSDWSGDVTLLTNSVEGLDTSALVSAGLKVDTRDPEAFETGDDARVRFTDGTDVRFAAVFTASRADLTGSCADSLGCRDDRGPLGTIRPGRSDAADIDTRRVRCRRSVQPRAKHQFRHRRRRTGRDRVSPVHALPRVHPTGGRGRMTRSARCFETFLIGRAHRLPRHETDAQDREVTTP